MKIVKELKRSNMVKRNELIETLNEILNGEREITAKSLEIIDRIRIRCYFLRTVVQGVMVYATVQHNRIIDRHKQHQEVQIAPRNVPDSDSVNNLNINDTPVGIAEEIIETVKIHDSHGFDKNLSLLLENCVSRRNVYMLLVFDFSKAEKYLNGKQLQDLATIINVVFFNGRLLYSQDNSVF